MTTPRKHSNIIKAWADGHDIQYYAEDIKDWIDIKDPGFYDGTKYRVKPKEIVKYMPIYHNMNIGLPMSSPPTKQIFGYITLELDDSDMSVISCHTTRIKDSL